MDIYLVELSRRIYEEKPYAFVIRKMIEEYLNERFKRITNYDSEKALLKEIDDLSIALRNQQTSYWQAMSDINKVAKEGNLQKVIEMTEPVILA